MEIFRQVSRNLDLGLASILAISQFLILALAGFVYLHFSRKYAIPSRGPREAPSKISMRSLSGLAESIFLLLIVSFVALPLIALVSYAFFDPRSGSLSLSVFGKIFVQSETSLFGVPAISSVFYSLSFALIASLLATLFGLVASLKQSRVPFIGFFLASSVAVSIVTLGFGYLIGFGSGSFMVIALSHSVLAFPFAFRVLSNALSKIDPETIDSARTLGASDNEVFLSIQLPNIRGALLVSMAFSFAVSLGELALVLILFDGLFPTMPVHIYRLITTYDIPAAAAMGLILVGVSFLCFYVIEFFAREEQVL